MPFYEYECGRCGDIFTVKQHMDDEPIKTHGEIIDPDDCNGHVERKISAPSLKFKGSGFYVNDYARKNSPR